MKMNSISFHIWTQLSQKPSEIDVIDPHLIEKKNLKQRETIKFAQLATYSWDLDV